MKPEKLYRCPACGDIITDEEYEKQLQANISGYCYCDFSTIDPDTGEFWLPRILHKYDVYYRSLGPETIEEAEEEEKQFLEKYGNHLSASTVNPDE